MASEFFSAKDYEKAMLAFDNVLTLNLDHIASIYNKAAKYGDDKTMFYYFADVYNKKIILKAEQSILGNREMKFRLLRKLFSHPQIKPASKCNQGILCYRTGKTAIQEFPLLPCIILHI